MQIQQLTDQLIGWGADRVAVVPVSDIVFDAEFRKACEANLCGIYGKCWMCPPDVGDIESLIARAKQYRSAVVYQTISPLEDSYDIEGMEEAAKRHSKLTQQFQKATREDAASHLHLSAGGCHVCESCTKTEGQPCRCPDLALPSLEAYGIHVSKLAEAAGMKYINGVTTVTYFGAMLIGLNQ